MSDERKILRFVNTTDIKLKEDKLAKNQARRKRSKARKEGRRLKDKMLDTLDAMIEEYKVKGDKAFVAKLKKERKLISGMTDTEVNIYKREKTKKL